MNAEVFAKRGRIMLVSSSPSEDVKNCLLATGFEVITVSDGEDAIVQAQRAAFNLAVLVSTGEAMDMAETVFNLRDISRSLQIIIISGEPGSEPGGAAEIIARTSPNTHALTASELLAYLGVPGSSARQSLSKERSRRSE